MESSSRAKTILLWTGIAGLCFIAIPFHLSNNNGNNGDDEDSQQQLRSVFENYTYHFNKSYTRAQFKERLPHFKKSLEQIALLNSENSESSGGKLESTGSQGHGSHGGHKFATRWRDGMKKNVGVASWGLTPLADLSPEEFQSTYLDKTLLQRILKRRMETHPHPHGVEEEDNLITRRRKKRAVKGGIPDKVDWRTKGSVTGVKHQKACGACWAFSTVETVESMRAIQGGPLQPLSIQQVIDCSEHNSGCSGGDTCSAIKWMSTRKLATEEQYPLTLKDGKCKFKDAPSGVQVNANYTCNRYEGNEDSILDILANHGPVAVAVDATNWQFYMGGVIQWNCDSRVNHAVQIVGYDKTSEPPHYILRNSWGPTFGDSGYLYVAIGSNLCGIATEVTALSVA